MYVYVFLFDVTTHTHTYIHTNLRGVLHTCEWSTVRIICLCCIEDIEEIYRVVMLRSKLSICHICQVVVPEHKHRERDRKRERDRDRDKDN